MAAIEEAYGDLVEKLDSNGGAAAPEEPAENGQSATEARHFPWPAISFREDPEESPPVVEVNCDERMHICHAVCCKLNFALTPEEVDSGTVKWDLGNPYFIRHEENGYCTHNDAAGGGCRIYADRPGVCRRYSCANDKRIWKDFKGMVLNDEWIDEHLSNSGRIFLGPLRPKMEVLDEVGP